MPVNNASNSLSGKVTSCVPFTAYLNDVMHLENPKPYERDWHSNVIFIPLDSRRCIHKNI